MSLVLFNELKKGESFFFKGYYWLKSSESQAKRGNTENGLICSFGEEFDDLLVTIGDLEKTKEDQKLELIHSYVSMLISDGGIYHLIDFYPEEAEEIGISKVFFRGNKCNVYDKFDKKEIPDEIINIGKDLEEEMNGLGLEDHTEFLNILNVFAVRKFEKYVRKYLK